MFSFVLSRMFNFYIDKTSFPNSLKQAYTTPVHKKDETNDKNNYRPVTILPSLSKALKSTCIINFMLTLIVFFLRPNVVLEKATVLSIQLLQWLKNGEGNLDPGGICRALFTDLSQTFDCLVHDFLIAKLKAYDFTYESLKLINSYLTDRKHRTKINSSYSLFLDLLIGVPRDPFLVHSY